MRKVVRGGTVDIEPGLDWKAKLDRVVDSHADKTSDGRTVGNVPILR